MRFLRDLVVFISPLVVLALLVEGGLRRVDTLHFSRARALQGDLSPIRVLATGNSHEAIGIDCRAMGTPCFNLAAGSQSLSFDLRLLEKYRARFTGVQQLLIGVSYQSLQASSRVEESQSFEYWHAYEIDGEDHDLPRFDVRRFSVFATFGPERSLEYVLKGFKSGTTIPKPWEHLPAQAIVTQDMTEAGANRRVARHHAVMSHDAIGHNAAVIRSMIRIGKELGARVTLLISPVSSYYLRHTRPRDVELLQQTVAQLATEEQVGLKSYWADPRFTDDLFRDTDHLAPNGTQQLSRLLKAEVIER